MSILDYSPVTDWLQFNQDISALVTKLLRFAAWRRLPNEKFKVRTMFLAAFAKPLLPAGRFIQQKLNLKNKCKQQF